MAEKSQTQPLKSESTLKSNNNGGKSTTNKRAIWDCGSTLYDSFELNSFQKQLDSAIISSSSRTHSMPRHLPSDLLRKAAPPLPPPPEKKKSAAVSKKLSRSFQKLLKSVFKRSSGSGSEASNDSSSSSPDPWFLGPPAQTEKEKVDGGRYFVTYEKPNGLSTIPEVPEIGLSPEVGPLVRKTMSDRISIAPLGIYCA